MDRLRGHWASVVEVLGLALLVAFAASWGWRWGLLAGGLALLALGLALGDSEPAAPREVEQTQWIS